MNDRTSVPSERTRGGNRIRLIRHRAPSEEILSDSARLPSYGNWTYTVRREDYADGGPKAKGENEMKMKTVIIATTLSAVAALAHADTKVTYRDAMGRIQATETTDRNGKTTYRDGMGRIQATVTTDRNGKTTYRDNMGRVQATVTTDRSGKTTYRDAMGRIQGTKTVDHNGKATYRDSMGRIQGTGYRR